MLTTSEESGISMVSLIVTGNMVRQEFGPLGVCMDRRVIQKVELTREGGWVSRVSALVAIHKQATTNM